MDPEFMHEFDLVIVPSSVSSIELNATMKFLDSIKWVFETRVGIPPTLLICPSRVLDSQLDEDPFSKEKFSMPFMLLPPVLRLITSTPSKDLSKTLLQICGQPI